MKTVVYEGYEFQVPASWPVYRLDEHPRTCVRYDVHAVYLGKPGPNMQCAAGLVGRTQTVSFIPGAAVASGTGARRPGQPTESGATVLQRLSAVHGIVTQNAAQHELSVALGAGTLGATILGTYGTDVAVIEQVLNTLHLAPSGAAQTAQSASVPAQPGGTDPWTSQRARLSSGPVTAAPQDAPAASAQAAASPKRALARKAAATATSTSWPGVPTDWPTQIVQSPPKPTPTPLQPVGGFDTCTAPSLNTMDVWRSDYAAIGVYIGGANAACAYGNLSASWVRTVTRARWGILPTYVGLQAPCWSGPGALINPGDAPAEGKAAAADALSKALALGFGKGSPIYYDMEAYNGDTACTDAVLQFLGAWDRQVAAAGYVSGVYSSQDSGIVDMQAGATARTPGFTPPVAIWIALWDDNPSLSDGTLVWPLSDRAKQYEGNVNATIGGITLNIDKDIVGGPVAH